MLRYPLSHFCSSFLLPRFISKPHSFQFRSGFMQPPHMQKTTVPGFFSQLNITFINFSYTCGPPKSWYGSNLANYHYLLKSEIWKLKMPFWNAMKTNAFSTIFLPPIEIFCNALGSTIFGLLKPEKLFVSSSLQIRRTLVACQCQKDFTTSHQTPSTNEHYYILDGYAGPNRFNCADSFIFSIHIIADVYIVCLV